jgi:hypothetical protein
MEPFATKTELMPHQVPAVAKLLPVRVGALLMDMGTGKSRTLLDVARLRQQKWDRLFWFTPCALRDNVAGEVLRHTDLTRADVCVWDDAARSAGIPRSPRVHIVGIETMSTSDRAVLAYNDLVGPDSFVVVDESTYIKSNRAKRSQRITNMSRRSRYRAILTGAPMAQGAVDLYGQMAFLSPSILGYRSFWSFAANHLEYEERRGLDGRKRRTGRIVTSHNEDYLAAKIAPYAYQIRKDECLDLPAKLYETRQVSMTADQKALYERVKEEVLALDYDDWSPITIFHLFTSLQTIACGFWRRPDGQVVSVDHWRLALLMETVGAIPVHEPVVVWAKYRRCVDEIVAALAAAHGTAAVCPFHGGLSEAERGRQLARWRAGARFLVATQAIGGHGLTLTEAAYAIFYADGYKSTERLQAEDRLHRIGQTRRPVYVSLRVACGIDWRIDSALARKADALREFQDRINVYRAERLRERALALVRSL